MTGSSPQPAPPTGTITFLFTDVEGSTRMWAEDSDAMASSLRVHDDLLRTAIEENDGYVFTTAGDSFAAAFSRASNAVAAAVAAQQALANATWPGPALRVRMGLHLGEADERDGDYFGPCVNTAARIETTAHGGQIVLSSAVSSLANRPTRDLGEHHLRDVSEPVHLFQVGNDEFPGLRVTDPAASNLPVRPTRLLGRDDDIRRAREMLLDRRLVTVAAVGGSGKTRLAIAIGEEELPRRPGGVWFVDLTSVLSPDEVPSAVAEASGLSLVAGDPTDQVIRYFTDKDALIILDNCEHVIDGAAEFCERFLGAGCSTRILATSREALDVEGESVISLRSLPCNGHESPGVRLFLDRALSVFPQFEVSDANLSVVSELCTRLDGMPLAIELAAARVTVMTARELLDGLDDRFQLLSGGRRRQRQRTLEATLDWSYDLLAPDEKRTFRSLGVFVDGFDLDAMATVADVERSRAVELLESLVAKSLVVRSDKDGSARFVLLETLKAYAEDRLASEGESSAARDRHLEHFLAISHAFDSPLAPDFRPSMKLHHDASNLVAAFEWAFSREQWSTAAHVLWASDIVLTLFGRAPEMLALLERAQPYFDAADRALGARNRGVQITAEVVTGRGTLPNLTASLSQESRGAVQILAMVWHAWVSALFFPEQAWAILEEAERLFDEEKGALPEGDVRSCVASLWYCQAVLLGYQGDVEAALAKSEETLAYERSNDHLTVIGTLLGSAPQATICNIILGHPERALQILEQNRSLGHDKLLFSDGSELRPLALLEMGRVEEATEEIRRSALRALQGRFPREEGDMILALAKLALAEGDEGIARDLLATMGPCRQTATMMAAREMARRLGVETEQFESFRDVLLAERRDGRGPVPDFGPLRAELARRGWLD